MATKSSYQRLTLLLLTSFILGIPALISQAQGTAFTYQGRLNDGATAANGNYDFNFRLATDPVANNYVGSTVTTNDVRISNGLFTVTVDFGPGLFVGSNYWLEIDTRTNGASIFTTLSPRQAVTPAPYAIMANSASNLLGNLQAGQLAGTLANNNFPANPAFTGSVTAGSFSGNGANLSSVNALALNGLNATNFWQTGGNNVGSGQFLGSTNNQSVEVRVNRQRAFLITPTTTDAPNIIGGAPVNVVDTGTKGAVIAGGGTTNFLGSSSSNRISADFGAIVGGSGNSIQSGADHSFIGSGWGNTISNTSYQSVIAGGQNNSIDTTYSVIVGGSGNSIQTNSDHAFIGSGLGNTISNSSGGAIIVGGQNNSLAGNFGFIGGGLNDTIQYGIAATIGGGVQNLIQSNSYEATIAGGWTNFISGNTLQASIGGGRYNAVYGTYGTISGGAYNTIGTNTLSDTIGGGYQNTITNNTTDSVIAGGSYSTIGSNSPYSTIAGGTQNTIRDNSGDSTIGGGNSNHATNIYSTVAGGYFNLAGGQESTVSGGDDNKALANEATVGGGEFNFATADFATVGGGQFNWNNASHAVIAGGFGNTNGGYGDTIGGGFNNLSAGYISAMGGGYSNADYADYSVLGGGYQNTIQPGNAAFIGGGYQNIIQSNSFEGTIAGGWTNVIGTNAYQSAIGGGYNNTALGVVSTIPGGANNVASGLGSFAAGQRAKATNDGAFVWADSIPADFTSTNANSFNVRALGGVHFVTAGSGMSVDGAVSGSFTGDGSGLTNVWRLGGNNISPGQFIGSINNQPVEIWANNQRVFRIEPAVGVNGAPNIIGGLANNGVFGSAIGAVIGGGTYNTVSNAYSTIAGGLENISDGYASTVAGGYVNYATNQYATVAGGSINIASSFAATVGGGSGNDALASYSTASGGYGNIASGPGSTIAGGGYDGVSFGGNLANGSASVIGGGIGNRATGSYATIAGGLSDLISSGAVNGTIGGGVSNYVNGISGTVAGGEENTANNFRDTVGGGFLNVASGGISTVAGGWTNIASGNASAILGGDYNVASGVGAAIGGGGGNQATNLAATIPGGHANIAGGQYSFAAGQQARALHDGSFVWADFSGGTFSSTANNQFLVRAQGGVGINTSAIVDNDFCINTNTYLFSHAIYLRGETVSDHHHGLAYCGNGVTNFGTVLPDGPVLWGFGGGALGSSNPNNHSVLTWDNIGVTISSSAASQNSEPELTVNGQRQGGFGTPLAYVHNTYPAGILGSAPALRVVNDGTSLDGALSVSTQGTGLIAEFGNAGSFVVTIGTNGTVVANGVTLTSDRNAKENFTDIDAKSILEKVVSLPLSEWNYKIDDATQKHLGPMAQDFHAAFGLDGSDDKHISVVDEGGVALAAIQGLNQKLDEKDAEIEKLKTENESMAARLTELETAVKSLARRQP